MNHNELNQWRLGLKLPFRGIRQAKLYRDVLEARLQKAADESDQLLESFKQIFKGQYRPIYLHRASNTASRAFKWRLSESKVFGFEANAKTYSLLTQDVLNVLRSVGVSEVKLEQILEVDFKRIHLNYQLNHLHHELARLNAFIEEFEAWRKLPQTIPELRIENKRGNHVNPK